MYTYDVESVLSNSFTVPTVSWSSPVLVLVQADEDVEMHCPLLGGVIFVLFVFGIAFGCFCSSRSSSVTPCEGSLKGEEYGQ